MLIIPVGIPGCGKSTLAGELVQEEVLHPDSIVSPDRFRQILTGDKTNQSANDLAWRLVKEIANARLIRDLNVYLDATNLVVNWYADILGFAQFHNQKVVYIWFDNPMQAINRNLARPDTEQVPQNAMRKMVERWKQVDLPLTSDDPFVRIHHNDDPNLVEDLRGYQSL